MSVVVLALCVVVVRRSSIAVAVVSAQALVLAGVAARDASNGHEIASAAALVTRAAGLAALLLLVVARTRAPQPVPAGVAPVVRAGLAVALALAVTWLIPTIGLTTRDAERAVLALVAFGLITVATRRATLLQVVGRGWRRRATGGKPLAVPLGGSDKSDPYRFQGASASVSIP